MKAKMAFGGGCHWCTEAVFAALAGVAKVEQGWVKSVPPNDSWSEAVIVHYDAAQLSIEDLVGVHVYTHSATANHPLRSRYRSAIYFFDETSAAAAKSALAVWQSEFSAPLLTGVYPFGDFKPSLPEHQDYYATDPDRPFCVRYIQPKLAELRQRFAQLLAAR